MPEITHQWTTAWPCSASPGCPWTRRSRAAQCGQRSGCRTLCDRSERERRSLSGTRRTRRRRNCRALPASVSVPHRCRSESLAGQANLPTLLAEDRGTAAPAGQTLLSCTASARQSECLRRPVGRARECWYLARPLALLPLALLGARADPSPLTPAFAVFAQLRLFLPCNSPAIRQGAITLMSGLRP